MSLPRPPLPLPLLDGNRPDKFPHLSLRLPVIFLSSKSVRNAESRMGQKDTCNVWVVRGCFWPILDSALRTLFDERNITGNLKERCGNLSGRFPSSSGSGSGGRGRLISRCLDGVRCYALTLRTNNNPCVLYGVKDFRNVVYSTVSPQDVDIC